MSEVLDHLRKIRNSDSLTLKPSPYLKSCFTDEYGNERVITIRNYQAQSIMNMLMMERFVNGDDCGLGKTIEVLSTIGYVLLKEPEYVPVILTTKSALFQWKSECEKFMQGLHPFVISGEPHERQTLYDEFFANDGRKKLLLTTYDTMFRDLDPSIVRDKSVKVEASVKKQLKSARSAEKSVREKAESLISSLKERTEAGTYDESEYAFARMNGKEAKRPSSWLPDDEKLLEESVAAKKELASVRLEVSRLSDLVAPPVHVQGLAERLSSARASGSRIMFVLDEAHKVKNYRSQVHEKVKIVSDMSDRVVAMTATPVKNKLMEFFGIFRVVKPDLFPKVTKFQDSFCVTKLQRVAGGRQVPVVVGYKNLDSFVSAVEPYYLSRKKHEVAKELPELISVEVQCELHELQDELYDMAEAGVGDSDDEEENYADVLSSLTMCQQAVNAPQLILNDEGKPFEGPSSKVDALIDLLEDEAAGRKVIIFSRFEKMISHVESVFKLCKQCGKPEDNHKSSHPYEPSVKYVRITGKENNPRVRQQARETFQDPKSGVDVIMITTAGSESLNLQAAEHFVFLDLPWSTGDYLQLIGRMIRIGSSHTTVVAHHFLASRRDGTKTIDHHVLRALREKKKLMDKVAGDSLKGGLQLTDTDAVKDVLSVIRGEASKNSKNKSSQRKTLKLASKGEDGERTISKERVKHDDVKIESPSIDFSDI